MERKGTSLNQSETWPVSRPTRKNLLFPFRSTESVLICSKWKFLTERMPSFFCSLPFICPPELIFYLTRVQAIDQDADRDEFKMIGTLKIDIMEGREIARSTKVNPYCVILLDQVEKTTTTTKFQTKTPFWGQEYIFEWVFNLNLLHQCLYQVKKTNQSDLKPTNQAVTIMINDQNKAKRDPRIGKTLSFSNFCYRLDLCSFGICVGLIEIKIKDLNPSGKPLDKWFQITQAPGCRTFLSENASLRLKITLTVEKILPSHEYRDFLEVPCFPFSLHPFNSANKKQEVGEASLYHFK